MANIVYRHYQRTDDFQLSDLFNRAFQMNGGGFVRTPKGLNWRYIQSPGFEPEMIQIAEDRDSHKIVGAVYVNLIETVRFNKDIYIVGDINDVSCLPEYTKRGIATNLMHRAIDYMKRKNCDLSILSADFKGFARRAIYQRLGYKDFDRCIVVFGFVKPIVLIKNLPIFTALFPVFLLYYYLPRFFIKIRFKKKSFLKQFNYKIFHDSNHQFYRKTANNFLSKYYNGFPLYSKEKMQWARVQTPAKRHSPTYILIYQDKKPIGGACITQKNMYAFKYGIKIRIGIIHEIFIEKKAFNTNKEFNLGYLYLIDKIIEAARQRNIGAVIYIGIIGDYDLTRNFRKFCFLSFKSIAIMFKKLKKKVGPLKDKRPLFVPTYVSLGFP